MPNSPRSGRGSAGTALTGPRALAVRRLILPSRTIAANHRLPWRARPAKPRPIRRKSPSSHLAAPVDVRAACVRADGVGVLLCHSSAPSRRRVRGASESARGNPLNSISERAWRISGLPRRGRWLDKLHANFGTLRADGQRGGQRGEQRGAGLRSIPRTETAVHNHPCRARAPAPCPERQAFQLLASRAVLGTFRFRALPSFPVSVCAQVNKPLIRWAGVSKNTPTVPRALEESA